MKRAQQSYNKARVKCPKVEPFVKSDVESGEGTSYGESYDHVQYEGQEEGSYYQEEGSYYQEEGPSEYEEGSQAEDLTEFNYSCDHCDFQTETKNAFISHVASLHGETCYPCDYCNFKSRNKTTIKRHVQSVHEGVRYPCLYCDYQATHKCNLKTHIESKHADIFFYCEDCNFKSDEVAAFKAHVECHGYFCCPWDECYFKTANKTTIKRHVQSVHEGVRYPCTYCNYQATHKCNLKTHIQSVHGQSLNSGTKAERVYTEEGVSSEPLDETYQEYQAPPEYEYEQEQYDYEGGNDQQATYTYDGQVGYDEYETV